MVKGSPSDHPLMTIPRIGQLHTCVGIIVMHHITMHYMGINSFHCICGVKYYSCMKEQLSSLPQWFGLRREFNC